MKLLEFLEYIIMALVPSSSSDPRAQLKWRWAVAAGMFIGFLCIATMGAWAMGGLPKVPRIATMGDLDQARRDYDAKLAPLESRLSNIERTTDAINLQMIRGAIQESLIKSCAAQMQANQPALDAANEELYGSSAQQGLLDQYLQISKRPFRVPDCKTTLITPKTGK